MMNARLHWTVRNKWRDAWKAEVAWAVLENKKKLWSEPADFCSVTVEYHTVHLMDKDGAYASLKPILDGLVAAGVIKDDSPEYILLELTQIKIKKIKDQKVVIKLQK